MENMQVTPHPEWKILYEKFNEAEYGTFISHQELEELMGVKQSQKYYNLVGRWKNEMLRKASRHIECLNGKGYEIVKPNGFRGSANRQLKLGHKRIRKAGQIVVKAPLDLCSEDEKKKLGDMGVILSQILHYSKETMAKVKEIDKKTDQLMIDLTEALDVAD